MEQRNRAHTHQQWRQGPVNNNAKRGGLQQYQQQQQQPQRRQFQPCPHCRKQGHAPQFCWWRPDARCNKCNQNGHIEKVCKARVEPRQQQQANVVNEPEEETHKPVENAQIEYLFVATCSSATQESSRWIVDSGCTNHMSFEEHLFCKLDKRKTGEVELANGVCVDAIGVGDVQVNTPTGMKLITNVMFVPDLSVNLLSVGQMIEENYSLVFSKKACTIFDPKGYKWLEVSIRDKSFIVKFDKNFDVGSVKSRLGTSKLGQERMSQVIEMGETSKSQEKRIEKLEALLQETKKELRWTVHELEKALRNQSFGSDYKGKRKYFEERNQALTVAVVTKRPVANDAKKLAFQAKENEGACNGCSQSKPSHIPSSTSGSWRAQNKMDFAQRRRCKEMMTKKPVMENMTKLKSKKKKTKMMHDLDNKGEATSKKHNNKPAISISQQPISRGIFVALRHQLNISCKNAKEEC